MISFDNSGSDANEDQQETVVNYREENHSLKIQVVNLEKDLEIAKQEMRLLRERNSELEKELRILKQNQSNDNISKKLVSESKNEFEHKDKTGLGSKVLYAKHTMYLMTRNTKYKYWSAGKHKHAFTFTDDIWIMGNKYKFHGNDGLIALDIYSKIWITYRSNFDKILSSSYASDAGWGCMLRSTQMLTAQALMIMNFDYGFNLSKISDAKSEDIYYSILTVFNDTYNNKLHPLSIHNMLSYGCVLYNKPIGHWYGPMESCFMMKKCIENDAELNSKIKVIVNDSQTINKSDISLNKCTLVFLSLRLGLGSLNLSYIKSIKRCFHLKECIGFIGGKPKKSLYFIGYQKDKLFYLDPHIVMPTPDGNKSLLKQKFVFHCQEINSLPVKKLDPSMAVAFFIKPNKQCLNSFWKNAAKVTNHKYSVFSIIENKSNGKGRIGGKHKDVVLKGADDHDEWEVV
eukprot:470268_1